MRLGLWMALVCALAWPARADLRLHQAFGDHMVLQRERPVAIWGWAAAGEKVSVAFAGQTVATTAEATGRWRVQLAPLSANREPQGLTVTGSQTLIVRDVLVGDVWLCSGQSNMAFGLGGCAVPEDVRAADLPTVRYRGYWEHFSGTPEEDLLPGAGWQRVSPQTAEGCTAVGFYFARRIAKETGVPIGLLESTVGGTEIECWMPPQSFVGCSTNEAIGQKLADEIAAWRQSLPAALDETEKWLAAARAALAQGTPIPPRPRLPGHPNEDREHWVRIQSLYNGMIHPLIGFAIKGVLWYQGENNGSEGRSYVDKQRAMVEAWRKLWGYDFPFYYVQLANWQQPTGDPAGGDGWARGRMAQLECLSLLPGTGMAVAIDVGDAADIHPRNKFDVGERLARWALAKDYGQTKLVRSGPLYRMFSVEGNMVYVSFEDHSVGSGLMVGRKEGRLPVIEELGGELKGFAIAGADRVWHWADARIDDDTVIVTSPHVSSPVAVRYGYAMNPAGCNLYNRDGLPASPFRTDDW